MLFRPKVEQLRNKSAWRNIPKPGAKTNVRSGRMLQLALLPSIRLSAVAAPDALIIFRSPILRNRAIKYHDLVPRTVLQLCHRMPAPGLHSISTILLGVTTQDRRLLPTVRAGTLMLIGEVVAPMHIPLNDIVIITLVAAQRAAAMMKTVTKTIGRLLIAAITLGHMNRMVIVVR